MDGAVDRARTRRRMLRDGAVGAAAVYGVLGLSAAGRAAGAPLRAADAKILNFLLELERLQASFFARVGADTRFGAEVRQFAKVAANQDRAHVGALRSVLGPAAAGTTAQLRADPRNDADFVRDAVALKEAAVAAYIGEAPNLHVDRITRVAEIVSVEARHAAWIRSIQDTIPAPRAADRSQTPSAVVRTLQQSGIVGVR
jgi:Ferritin-like domain